MVNVIKTLVSFADSRRSRVEGCHPFLHSEFGKFLLALLQYVVATQTPQQCHLASIPLFAYTFLIDSPI